MKYDQKLFIHPIINTWGFLANQRNKPLIQVSPADPLLKRAVASLSNCSKKRVLEVAIVISTIFTFLFSLISYPFRFYSFQKTLKTAITNDTRRISDEENKKTEIEINNYFLKHNDNFKNLSEHDKIALREKIIACVARSQAVYGPIIRNFVDHLLETAETQGKKLVFMARDGIPYYEVANQLMKTDEYKTKFPKLTKEKSLSLAYFSRKVVENGKKEPEKFKKYTEQLGIQDNDCCIFVDIGFEGKMADPIRALLPNVNCEFEFLIATTNKAKGFLATPDKPLSKFKRPQGNLATGWLEQTHSGTLDSATKLVQNDKGEIYPNNQFPEKKRGKGREKYSEQYLLKKFTLRRVIDYALANPFNSSEEKSKAKEIFNQTLGHIAASNLYLYATGDYYKF